MLQSWGTIKAVFMGGQQNPKESRHITLEKEHIYKSARSYLWSCGSTRLRVFICRALPLHPSGLYELPFRIDSRLPLVN